MNYRINQNDLEKMNSILKFDGLYAAYEYLEQRIIEVCDHSGFKIDDMAMPDIFDSTNTMLNLIMFPSVEVK